MTWRAPLVAVAVAAVALAACGGGSTRRSGPPRVPTGADDVVLRVSLTGGFVHPGPSNAFPEVTLYGDGRVILRGPSTLQLPGPALANLVEFRLDEAGITHILRSAADAGVLDRRPPDYGRLIAADVPTTVVTVRAGGTLHRVSVFGLGLDPNNRNDLSDGQRANRERLRRLVDEVGDSSALKRFVQPGTERRYEPTAVAVFVSPAGTTDGVMHPWPLGELAATDCTVFVGADAATLLAAAHTANDGDVWEAAGAPYTVAFRPLLPDERTCADLNRRP
jgi:hypothetical protein